MSIRISISMGVSVSMSVSMSMSVSVSGRVESPRIITTSTSLSIGTIMSVSVSMNMHTSMRAGAESHQRSFHSGRDQRGRRVKVGKDPTYFCYLYWRLAVRCAWIVPVYFLLCCLR